MTDEGHHLVKNNDPVFFLNTNPWDVWTEATHNRGYPIPKLVIIGGRYNVSFADSETKPMTVQLAFTSSTVANH